jgi:hypothetical protein
MVQSSYNFALRQSLHVFVCSQHRDFAMETVEQNKLLLYLYDRQCAPLYKRPVMSRNRHEDIRKSFDSPLG